MTWKPRITGSGPIYLELADAIGEAIRSGELAPGDRLPTQREMAEAMGVDLTTVTRGYAQAQRLSYIESEGRRGSFVKAQPARRSALDMSGQNLRAFAGAADANTLAIVEASGRNMPPEPAGDLLSASLREGLERVLHTAGPLALHYQPTGGLEHDRAVRADVFGRAAPTHPDQIVITAGAQNAIHGICSGLLQPGDAVACGRYTYPGFLSVVRKLGARIVPIEMDRKGLIPDSLEEAARRQPLKLLYHVPHNANPTTASIDGVRRLAIAELAEMHDFQILEDDAYGGLNGYRDKVVSFVAPGRSWYVVTISKSFTPALRVATVRAPSIRDAYRLIASIQDSTTMAAPLDVALDTQWLTDGTLLKLGSAVAAEGAERQKVAREILGAEGFVAAPGGYHLWIPLPDRDAPLVSPPPMLTGLPVAPAAIFAAAPTGLEQSLRVSLGGPRSRERVRSDLSRLAAFLAHNHLKAG